MFDLNLLPLKLVDGQEQNTIPGLLVAAPPRRRERSHSGDLLMLLLNLSGSSLPESGYQELLERLASIYYRTRGPATTGLRAAIGELNSSLLRRNLRERENGQLAGTLNAAVLRRDMLFLAHAGAAQSLLLSQEGVLRFCEPEGSSSAMRLGVSRAFSLRFAQARVQVGDFLVFSSSPPTAWNAESLSGTSRLLLDQARRRLLGLAGTDVEAAVVHFQSGSGQVHHLKPRTTFIPDEKVAAVETPAAEEPPVALEPAMPTAPAPEIALPPVVEPAEPAPVAEAAETPAPTAEPVVEAVYVRGDRAAAPEEALASPPVPRPRPIGTSSSENGVRTAKARVERKNFVAPRLPDIHLRRRLAAVWKAGRKTQRQVDRSGRTIAGRLAPGETGRALSPGLMLFIAIAVPLMVVAASVTVYLFAPGGRSEQQIAYLAQAQLFSEQAQQESDKVLQRNAWSQVLYWTDKADEFGKSDESTSLRRQAHQAIDSMDGVTRVSMQPATSTGFASNLNFTRIAATPNDVYLLDSTQGRVLRMYLTGTGYEVDPKFQCGPGPSGNLMISPLIDMALLPASNLHEATVAAIDSTGNLLFCKNEGFPESVTLPVPDIGWGQITEMSLDQGNLYLLDEKNNRVWIYVGSDLEFSEGPRLFFDNEVPTLNDIVDMAVNVEDLYLLHETGRMTTCVFRSFSFGQTKCKEPSPYGDQRPGRKAEANRFPEARFASMQTTQAPDSSLYILDTAESSVYHFSLRQNLQNVFRPDPDDSYPLPADPLTAFAIASNRVMFMAFGNQVYFGSMP